MSLRIACDLDGTLADMDGAVRREAKRLFGPSVVLRAGARVVAEAVDGEGAPVQGTPPDTAEGDGATTGGKKLSGRQMRELWRHIRRIENFWTTLEEIEPGAVSRLASLASLHRWDVLFLTQRPETNGETAQTQSQRWLNAHGFDFPSVCVMNGSRGAVAKALKLDAVLDDHPGNCLDVKTHSSTRSILVWRDEPKTSPAAAHRLGITVVHSVAEALQHLQAGVPASARSPRLVRRLYAAIGT